MVFKLIFFSDNQLNYQFLRALLPESSFHLKKYSPDFDFCEQLRSSKPDLVLLDENVGGLNGLLLLRSIKEDKELSSIAVIFFTSCFQLQHKIASYEMGAIDYLVATNHPLEIIARIKNKVIFSYEKNGQKEKIEIGENYERRRTSDSNQNLRDFIVYGGLKVNLITHQVTDNSNSKNELIPLSFLDYRILIFFLKNIEKKVSRQTLIRNVWGENIHISNRTVDVHISGLRKKSYCLERYIKTIYGKGYFFSDQLMEKKLLIKRSLIKEKFQDTSLETLLSSH